MPKVALSSTIDAERDVDGQLRVTNLHCGSNEEG